MTGTDRPDGPHADPTMRPPPDHDGDDSLVHALATLRVDPPVSLADRVVGRWVRVDGPPLPVYVAFTDQGISYVRIAATVDGHDDDFLDAYRSRFGRPLRAAARPPAGLAAALRTGRGTGLTYDLRGTTAFEQAVLGATLRIPRGETRPYGWIAREIGTPGAVRAVGTALGRNPVPVLIPCHRVTRADGAPGNYAFGPDLKLTLLRAEDVNLDEVRALAGTRVFYLASATTGIFCYPTCHQARRITERHRRTFRTVAEATAAGFRACRQCRPAVPPADGPARPASDGPAVTP